MKKKEVLDTIKFLREDLELELGLESKYLNLLLAIGDREIKMKIIEMLGDISSHSVRLVKMIHELEKSLL